MGQVWGWGGWVVFCMLVKKKSKMFLGLALHHICIHSAFAPQFFVIVGPQFFVIVDRQFFVIIGPQTLETRGPHEPPETLRQDSLPIAPRCMYHTNPLGDKWFRDRSAPTPQAKYEAAGVFFVHDCG